MCDGIPYWDESCESIDYRCSYGTHLKERMEDLKYVISAKKRVSAGHKKGKIPDHVWDKEVFYHKIEGRYPDFRRGFLLDFLCGLQKHLKGTK